MFCRIFIIKLPMLVCVCMLLLTCMSQAEGPEAQVGGCVGDASQTVLYGVDGLVNSYVTKVKLWWKDKMVSTHSMVIVNICICVCVFVVCCFFLHLMALSIELYWECKGMASVSV